MMVMLMTMMLMTTMVMIMMRIEKEAATATRIGEKMTTMVMIMNRIGEKIGWSLNEYMLQHFNLHSPLRRLTGVILLGAIYFVFDCFGAGRKSLLDLIMLQMSY